MTPSDSALRESLARIVERVYETMLGAPAHADPQRQLRLESPLTAAVHYTGGWKGALVLECSAAQAARWSGQLMPLPPPLSQEDVRDGLGELTNMIAGNLKPLLPPAVSLSMPSVIEGTGHKLHLPGAEICEAMDFRDESGPFRIALVRFLEKPSRANSGAVH